MLFGIQRRRCIQDVFGYFLVVKGWWWAHVQYLRCLLVIVSLEVVILLAALMQICRSSGRLNELILHIVVARREHKL